MIIKKMSTALYLGIGGSVLLLIIIVVYMIMSGKKEEEKSGSGSDSNTTTTGSDSNTTTTGSDSNTTTGSGSNTTTGSGSNTTTGANQETLNVPVVEFQQQKVIICDGINFTNPCVELAVGDYNTAQMGIEKNKVSSIKVPRGLIANLFWNENFGGEQLVIRSDIPELKIFPNFPKNNNNWDNELASIKIKRDEGSIPRATFCDDYDYKGLCVELGKGDYNTNEMGFPKNTLSSVKVPSGMEVDLFWNENFNNPRVTLRNDTPDLRRVSQGSDNWDNDTASIKIS